MCEPDLFHQIEGRSTVSQRSARNFRERQQTFEVRSNGGVDNIQVHVLILVNRDIAKAHHSLQHIAQCRIDDARMLRQRKAFARITQDADSVLSNQHVGEVNRGLAGPRNVEDSCVLTCEVALEVIACLPACARSGRVRRSGQSPQSSGRRRS